MHRHIGYFLFFGIEGAHKNVFEAYLTYMKFILSHAFYIVDSTTLMHLILIWVLYNLNQYILLHHPLGPPLAYTTV
jgi:hypothetical protein